VLLLLFVSLALYAKGPKLFLLKTYEDDLNVTGWTVSEKLDGVRAYWDGRKLISRSGRVFNPPASFTQGFPPFMLDGELWSRRGAFESIASIVNTKAVDERWNELCYYIFDVPHQKGGLFERLKVLESYLHNHDLKRLKVIKQVYIKDKAHLKVYFDEVIRQGGEGVVIRDPNEAYYTGRTAKSLKYKPFVDAECRVSSIIEGKGKFKGKMGAVRCDFKGKSIKIGSGFTQKQRKFPPSIGTLVSFKYYGLTHLGNPRFPVFLRVRSDVNLSLMN